MNINWYPGHMAAARRMMEENRRLVDAVAEVRDARIPYASGNPDIQAMCAGKPRLVVLNKADLADPVRTDKWTAFFRRQGAAAVGVSSLRNAGRQVFPALEELLENRRAALAQKGITRPPRVLICGIPNCGKSTLINALCGTAKAKTGDKPGVTRGKQWVHAGGFELLDTPGILWPRLDQATAPLLAVTGAVNDQILEEEELALWLCGLLSREYPEAFAQRYRLTLPQENLALFEQLCRNRGFLLKGNEPDYTRGARVLLDELRKGTIGRMTLEVPQ